jgi:hypothetical protein
MLRWPQDINTEPLRGGCSKRTAVSVFASEGSRPPVGYSGFPVHMYASGPASLYLHGVYGLEVLQGCGSGWGDCVIGAGEGGGLGVCYPARCDKREQEIVPERSSSNGDFHM